MKNSIQMYQGQHSIIRCALKTAGSILMALLLFSVTAQAQPIRKKLEKRVDAQRIAFITERLNLSPEESQNFWPVYNEYRDKLKTIRQDRLPEVEIDQMNDAEAEKLIKDNLDAEQRELELKREYYLKLRKTIPPRKIALLMKAEIEFKGNLLKEIQKRREDRRND